MAKPLRHSDPQAIRAAERTFFVTSSTEGRRRLLQSYRSAELLIRCMERLRIEQGAMLHAWVVMPNHFHVVLTLPSSLSVEKSVQLIKGRFSFEARRSYGFPGTVWQRGFSEERVMDLAHFERAVNYIHENPVKAGLVRAAEEFPYSTASGNRAIDPPPQGLKPLSFGASFRHD